MVTGDHATAAAIAGQLGIEGRTLTRAEFAALPDDALHDQVGDIGVVARVAPEDKVRLVSILKEPGDIVAMTGDGVNDAPALARADIGVGDSIALVSAGPATPTMSSTTSVAAELAASPPPPRTSGRPATTRRSPEPNAVVRRRAPHQMCLRHRPQRTQSTGQATHRGTATDGRRPQCGAGGIRYRP
jgi:hypothetical protein